MKVMLWNKFTHSVNTCGGWRKALLRAFMVFRQEGIIGVRERLSFFTRRAKTSIAYDKWIHRYDRWTPSAEKKIRSRVKWLVKKPLISVIMPVFDPDLHMLAVAIESVLRQVYDNWELCIADDASSNPAVRELISSYVRRDQRIKAVFRDTNGHISRASNSALALSCGEFIALLDHDDKLAPDALYWVAETIINNPNAALIYSDEDKIDASGNRFYPYFKCDWNYELFLSHNMISHLGVYRKSVVDQVGGFRAGLEGSQDHDLALRCIELLDSSQIIHIPRILYHWRSHEKSTASSSHAKSYAQIAGIKAIQDHLNRTLRNATAELHPDLPFYRVRFMLPSPPPLVSLIIPTRNGLPHLKHCIESILTKTDYSHFEIVLVDNGSDDPEGLKYMESLGLDKRIRVFHDSRPFNYSVLNNEAVKVANGEILGLVNDDIEILTPGWLSEMVSLAIQPAVGAVGARLLYADGSLQHGGIILGVRGVAGHSHKGISPNDHGYIGRAKLLQSFSAVTGACLVIKKSIFNQVNGFDENLAIAFNDVDFCLKVRDHGFRNVWTPFAELIHYESKTRGLEDTPEKMERFECEVYYVKRRWGDALLKDPAYNPNLTLDDEDYSLACPPRREIL